MSPPPLRLVIVQSATKKGGVENLLLTWLPQMDRTMISPIVVTLGFHRGTLPDEVRALGVEVQEWNAGRIRRVHRTIWTILKLAWLGRRADVFVSYSIHAHIYARLAALLSRRPCVLVLHIVLSEKSEWDLATKVAMALGTSLVVANSQTTADSVRKAFPGVPIEMIYNSVHPTFLTPVDGGAAVRAKWKIKPDEYVVAMAARMHTGKGHATFIRAAALLKGRAKFLIAGEAVFGWSQDLPAELKDLVRRLDLQNDVHFVGGCDTMPAFYHASDIVVVPSETPESFCLTAAEAMASGIPVVATRVGALPEILGLAGVMVPPGDPYALSEAIRQLLDNANARKTLGQKGRERVRLFFSPDGMARMWEKFLSFYSCKFN